MCRFKSGIILKNKVVVAPGENDSHSDLLESLGIKDDYFGATNVFVRAELVPVNDEWWINPAEEPDKWEFIVDQDMRPEWFDKSAHEKIFREAVCDWWKEHVLRYLQGNYLCTSANLVLWYKPPWYGSLQGLLYGQRNSTRLLLSCSIHSCGHSPDHS